MRPKLHEQKMHELTEVGSCIRVSVANKKTAVAHTLREAQKHSTHFAPAYATACLSSFDDWLNSCRVRVSPQRLVVDIPVSTCMYYRQFVLDHFGRTSAIYSSISGCF
jgi:hypothetical protein